MSTRSELDLDIGGMTCASCVARVEKSLNRLDGVEASVNLATERAHIVLAHPVAVPELVGAVEKAGYSARLRAPIVPAHHEAHDMPGTDMHDMATMPGMDMSGADDSMGHMHHDSTRDLGRRLIVALVLAVPVVVISMIPALHFPAWGWVVLALSAAVVSWAAWPFHRGALAEVRHLAPGMDTLVSLGVVVATLWSVVALFLGGDTYFEVAAAVTAFVLLGRWIEARARHSAGSALRALAEYGASEAARLDNGVETRVPAAALKVGDLVRVRPGERIPADGVVVDGASSIDASAITGESVPEEAVAGSVVVGGSISGTGLLTVRLTRVGADTELARITALVEAAQTKKAAAQRLADRIAAIFVPIVIALAVLTFIGWLVFGGDAAHAGIAAVSVLLIACPCALGLATPVAILVGTTRGSQLGILIRGPEALERARRIDTVLLDKTGTLTEGRMSVTRIGPPAGMSEDGFLALVAAVESGSVHPIAAAIVRMAADRGLALAEVTDFEATAGAGVRGHVTGRQVVVGSPTTSGALPIAIAEAVAAIESDGATAIVVRLDGVDGPEGLVGVLGLADTVRPTAVEAIRALVALGARPVLVTGDNARAAQRLADRIGIADIHAGVSPSGKADLLAVERAAGHRVAMVGDGVNDAAALAAADLGIAVGGGTDAAIAAADLTLVGGDPARIATAIRLARRIRGIIVGNLFWAFAYNVVAIPLAVAGLLNPMIAGAAMAFSSVFVVLNSLRLRTFR